MDGVALRVFCLSGSDLALFHRLLSKLARTTRASFSPLANTSLAFGVLSSVCASLLLPVHQSGALRSRPLGVGLDECEVRSRREVPHRLIRAVRHQTHADARKPAQQRNGQSNRALWR
jgi:hypothetical protein